MVVGVFFGEFEAEVDFGVGGWGWCSWAGTGAGAGRGGFFGVLKGHADARGAWVHGWWIVEAYRCGCAVVVAESLSDVEYRLAC